MEEERNGPKVRILGISTLGDQAQKKVPVERQRRYIQ